MNLITLEEMDKKIIEMKTLYSHELESFSGADCLDLPSFVLECDGFIMRIINMESHECITDINLFNLIRRYVTKYNKNNWEEHHITERRTTKLVVEIVSECRKRNYTVYNPDKRYLSVYETNKNTIYVIKKGV